MPRGLWRGFLLPAVLSVSVALASGGASAAPGSPAAAQALGAARHAAQAEQRERVIATAGLHGRLAVALTAHRGRDDGGTPRATVTVSAWRQDGGSWRPLGRLPVGQPDAWFWSVVSGPGAVCELTLAGHPEEELRVRLLHSPSAGCSDTAFRFRVYNEQLVPW